MWLESVSRMVTLLVTNCVKLVGLYVGFHDAVQSTPNAIVLAFAAFLIAGGQVSENAVMMFIERFFGRIGQGQEQEQQPQQDRASR